MKASTYRNLLLFLLFIATIFLAVGLVTPIITLKKFIFIQNTFSIISGTWGLLKEGHLFLFFIISLFSIILPIFKIFFLANILYRASPTHSNTKKTLALLHRFGRWSMLDVYVVAILVVAVKLGAIADVEKHIGLYFYAASAILLMFIISRTMNLKSD